DKKSVIESALAELKDAHKSQNIDAIDAATAKLNTAWQTASEEMYKNAGAQEQQQPGTESGAQQEQKSGNDEVTDVDFEEVKDK
ncbi:MAG TPA: molecular chaperone DnaK, partial [Bacteroidales bacterium]|nr:molecular chaperone DnaK [Bacteroidales bacterium]